MIDTHAHLYFESFDGDRDEVLRRAREAGVEGIVEIGIDLATSRAALELAETTAGWAAVGLHPQSSVPDPASELAALAELARTRRGRIVAIGEIGLDFHHRKVAPQAQYPRFEEQLDLALELRLPVVIHCRAAMAELLGVLEKRRENPPGVLHCFSGGPEDAERALALGFHVSFAGNITYPRGSERLARALDVVPPERLLLETDTPFLAPQPVRGRRNEPAFLAYTRDWIARRKDLSPADLEAVADRNARALFALDSAAGSAGEER